MHEPHPLTEYDRVYIRLIIVGATPTMELEVIENDEGQYNVWIKTTIGGNCRYLYTVNDYNVVEQAKDDYIENYQKGRCYGS